MTYVPSIAPSHRTTFEHAQRPSKFFAKSLKSLFPASPNVPPPAEEPATMAGDSSRPA